jgi:hypothetical protein
MPEQIQTNWSTGIPPAIQFSQLSGYPLDLIQDINNNPWKYTPVEFQVYEEEENKYGFHYKQCGNSIRGDRITLATVLGNFVSYLQILISSNIPLLLSGRNPYNISRGFLPKWVLVCEEEPHPQLATEPTTILGPLSSGQDQYHYRQLIGSSPEQTAKLFIELIDFYSFHEFQLSIFSFPLHPPKGKSNE